MRIVSLFPAATEIVCALGLRDQLVGVSHACDYPPEIDGTAVVTRPRTAGGDATAHTAAPGEETGPAELDRPTLLASQPDLVIVREGGLGPSAGAVRAVFGEAEAAPSIISLDPVSLEGIFHAITSIGAMAETEDEAMGLIEVLREEVGAIEQEVVVRHDQGLAAKRVVVLEAIEPLLASGRWVPEQVRRAGGWDLLGREGEPPSETSWAAVRDVDPEMLVLAPAGLSLLETQRAWSRIQKPEFWDEIAAVRRGQVFVVEPVYFCRSGPRVVDGVGMLAEIFDPEGFVDTSPPSSWTLLFE
ncbi:MAG TPA: ABC transporter substrate-binding protein [Candidatus Limnocylindrales bacterium]